MSKGTPTMAASNFLAFLYSSELYGTWGLLKNVLIPENLGINGATKPVETFLNSGYFLLYFADDFLGD